MDSPRLDQRLRRGAAISARVHGNLGLSLVHADLRDQNVWGCTCPSEYRPCKHVAALVATHKKRPRSFVDLDQKLRKLRAMSAPELVKLVEKIVAEHPDAVEALGVRGFSRKSRLTDREFKEEEWPNG